MYNREENILWEWDNSMKSDWKLLGQIFLSFFKIGPVTFGGGYAMIPLIEREIVTKRKWVQAKDIADIFAVAESIPGAIAINSATFVGYRIAGIKGAISALLGVLFPTFMIVLAMAIAFLKVRDNPYIIAAFQGIRPAVVALIVFAAVKIGHTAIIDKTTLGTVIVTVSILIFMHAHPVFIILSGALAGIVLVKIKEKLGFGNVVDKEERGPVQVHENVRSEQIRG